MIAYRDIPKGHITTDIGTCAHLQCALLSQRMKQLLYTPGTLA